jgi:hypothetical protein
MDRSNHLVGSIPGSQLGNYFTHADQSHAFAFGRMRFHGFHLYFTKLPQHARNAKHLHCFFKAATNDTNRLESPPNRAGAKNSSIRVIRGCFFNVMANLENVEQG